MSVLGEIRNRAAKLNKTIVLPEGSDDRIVEAAAIANKERIARIILLGNPEETAKRQKPTAGI